MEDHKIFEYLIKQKIMYRGYPSLSKEVEIDQNLTFSEGDYKNYGRRIRLLCIWTNILLSKS